MATLGGVRWAAETRSVLEMLMTHWDEHGFGYWMAHAIDSEVFVGRGGLRAVEIAGRTEVEVGYAVMPEQSTVAIVAHHPQAVYFGMKSGFVPKEKAPDELIAGTERGGEVPASA